jgi:hypothetical protein
MKMTPLLAADPLTPLGWLLVGLLVVVGGFGHVIGVTLIAASHLLKRRTEGWWFGCLLPLGVLFLGAWLAFVCYRSWPR